MLKLILKSNKSRLYVPRICRVLLAYSVTSSSAVLRY